MTYEKALERFYKIYFIVSIIITLSAIPMYLIYRLPFSASLQFILGIGFTIAIKFDWNKWKKENGK